MTAICINCRYCDTQKDGIGRLRYWCHVHGSPAVLCGEERKSGKCGPDGALFSDKSLPIADAPIAIPHEL